MRINTLKLSLAAAAVLALSACEKAKTPQDAATTTTTPPTATAPAATPPATTPPAAAPAAGVTPGTPAGATTPGAHSPGLRAKFKAAKEACAADLQKFCATADKPFKCLKENEAQLSPACNAARAVVKAARQAGQGQ